MPSLAARLLAAASLISSAHAGCSNGQWTDAYCPERCYVDGEGAAVVSCGSKDGDQCGMRMSSNSHVGQGLHAMGVKAAPGDGVATTFYLSNNGGLYDKTKQHPWVEIDFEIMGHQAAADHTKIWTNLFTGVGVEHNQMITVPFDATAGYHTYAVDLTDSSVAWVVDGVTYRKEDITSLADVVAAVRSSAFQELVSVWGKSSRDAGEGIPEFREALGILDRNQNNFPIHAGFKRAQQRSADAIPARIYVLRFSLARTGQSRMGRSGFISSRIEPSSHCEISS
ncbi:unnamed protein product [Polarella glacialis]|uniref:GH16 domain-containing protein n=1 Tax=Polarella glacialis TaxID=89957 RepID=A0A813LZI3_POLGL|nr:unnamed protein product [Polarella glacialis]